MQTLFKIFLILHITGGTIALLSAPVAMIVHKGGKVTGWPGKLFSGE
jgi:hypothetical protein